MENKKAFQTDPALPLMTQVEKAMEYYRYSQITANAYCRWIKQYIDFLRVKKATQDRFQKEIGPFLSFLVQEKNLSRASQKQALNAIVFLFKRVFDVDIATTIKPVKQKNDPPLPVVMTPDEVRQVLSHLKGAHRLMAGLLYGSGLKLTECVRLRIGQLDFSQKKIYIYAEKTGKKREVMMSGKIKASLLKQVEQVRKTHADDLEKGCGKMVLPYALKSRYAGKEYALKAQYVFPGKKLKIDPKAGVKYRPCVLASGIQKAVKRAVEKAGLEKKVSCSTFRHSFALHLLENNTDIFTVKKLMGHKTIEITRRYVKLMEKTDDAVLSPLDLL